MASAPWLTLSVFSWKYPRHPAYNNLFLRRLTDKWPISPACGMPVIQGAKRATACCRHVLYFSTEAKSFLELSNQLTVPFLDSLLFDASHDLIENLHTNKVQRMILRLPLAALLLALGVDTTHALPSELGLNSALEQRWDKSAYVRAEGTKLMNKEQEFFVSGFNYYACM